MNARQFKSYCYNNRVDVRGHKYVFGPTQNHFSPSVARVKMSSEEGQKHIYAQERQLYYYYNNFNPLSGSVADLLQIENRAIFLQAGPGCYFYPQCYAALVVYIVAMAKIFNKSGFVLRK